MKRSRVVLILLTATILLAGGITVPLPLSSGTAPIAHAQVAGSPIATPSPGTSANGKTTPSSGDTVSPGLMGWIIIKIASLFAWLVGVAMLVLDASVYYGVVTMGTFVKGLGAIGQTWRILRDIGNLLLIFGFLASGIMVILNLNLYGFGSKMLPMLLLAAVFINFSLFISESIIDVGNLFATEFYIQINGGSKNIITPTQIFTNNAVQNEGVSNAIMKAVGLQTLYNNASISASSGAAGPAGAQNLGNEPWYIGFMSILLFLIAAFVMFSLAFVLIARFVALIFIIIIAPLGFAGLAIPGLSKTAAAWWRILVEQTVTAPVLLLLLYIALDVITTGNFLSEFGIGAGAATAWTGLTASVTTESIGDFIAILFAFIVAMGLLMVVVIMSKRMSEFGASLSSRAAGFLTFGVTSFAGRATLGGLGTAMSGKRMMAASTAREGDSRATRAGRLALRTLVVGSGKVLKNRTYDIRNIPGATKIPSVNVGTPAKKTGQQVWQSVGRVAPKAIGKPLDIKTGQYWTEAEKPFKEAAREADLKHAIKDLDVLNEQKKAGTISQQEYNEKALPLNKIIATTLTKMSATEVAELQAVKDGSPAAVANLSPQTFSQLMRNEKISESDKQKMRQGRYESLKGALGDNPQRTVDETAVRAWSASDLSLAAPDIAKNEVLLKNLATTLSDKQFEDSITKNEQLSRSEREAFTRERNRPTLDAIAGNDRNTVRQKTDKEIAAALPEIIKNDRLLGKFVEHSSARQYEDATKDKALPDDLLRKLKNLAPTEQVKGMLSVLDPNNAKVQPMNRQVLVNANIIQPNMTNAEASRKMQDLLRSMREKIGDLSADILTHDAVMKTYDTQSLKWIMTKDKLHDNEKSKIKEMIEGNPDKFKEYFEQNEIPRGYWGVDMRKLQGTALDPRQGNLPLQGGGNNRA